MNDRPGLVQRTAQAVARRAADWLGLAVPTISTLDDARKSRTRLEVTPDSALSLAAAWACVNCLSSDLASLPLKLYRKRRGGGRDEVLDDPRASILATTPDRETTSFRFRQSLFAHMLTWGNGYAEVGFDGNGEVEGLYLLSPRTTRAARHGKNGRLYYSHTGGTLPPYRVLHVAGLGFDGLSGYSPVRLAREAFALGLAAEAFGAGFFGNSSIPKGVLTSPRPLNDAAQRNLRESWESIHKGLDNTAKVAVLEGGVEFRTIAIPPEDAQWLQLRNFQVVEVCRIYRVPPWKVGDYSQAHRSTVEDGNLDYLTTTLAPWCESIEQAFNLKLLTEDERRRGWYVEHSMSAFLRGDMKSRAEFYSKLRDLGVFSPNDIASRENLNPIGPAGDIRLVPVNMQTLERAGAPPAPAPDPAPVPTPPADGGEA